MCFGSLFRGAKEQSFGRSLRLQKQPVSAAMIGVFVYDSVIKNSVQYEPFGILVNGKCII